LLLRVLLRTLTVPELLFAMPPPVPPKPESLLRTVLLLTFRVPELLFAMPAPVPTGPEFPLATVSPDRVTIPGLPKATLKTRLALLPEIVNRFAPGPVIVRFLLMANWPVVSVIGLTTWFMSKLIVAPSHASSIACRSDPAPASLLLMTVMLFEQAIT